MRAFLDRRSFNQLCGLTLTAASLLAGAIGGAIRYWTYDQAGDD